MRKVKTNENETDLLTITYCPDCGYIMVKNKVGNFPTFYFFEFYYYYYYKLISHLSNIIIIYFTEAKIEEEGI